MAEVMHYACLAVKFLLGVDEVTLRHRLLSRASPEWKEAYYAIQLSSNLHENTLRGEA